MDLGGADLGETTASQTRVLNLESPKPGSRIGLDQVPKNKNAKSMTVFPKLTQRSADCILVCGPTTPLPGCK